MGILIVLAALAAFGIVMVTREWCNMGMELLGMFASVLGIGGLAIALLAIPLEHMSVESEIAKFHETRAVAERMRDKGATWESAAFQTKIADMNGWMREMQYYNGTVFDLWIPDQVDELEPIK